MRDYRGLRFGFRGLGHITLKADGSEYPKSAREHEVGGQGPQGAGVLSSARGPSDPFYRRRPTLRAEYQPVGRFS